MLDSILLFFVGTFVGFFGTLIGVGGGFIVVPLLTIGYNFSPQLAVGTSLCIVALNAISGSIVYAKQQRIDYRTGIIFAIATIPGAYLGALILQIVSRMVFDIGFGILIVGLVVYMTLKRSSANTVAVDIKTFQRPQFNIFAGIGISFLVGFVASMAGIGGGVIHVPAMIFLFQYPQYIAIPTSHFILAISSIVAAASHASLGEVQWNFVPFLGVGAIIGAQIGGKISHKIKSVWIIRGLQFAMIVVAIRLFLRNF
jgi:hypothetical protein